MRPSVDATTGAPGPRPGTVAMGRLARLLVHIFFRGVEVEHAERLEPGRPTVLVADHRNGLVDGLLLMAVLVRYPRFLGKSTLFRNPLLWPFLRLAGVVPIYRTQDGGSPEGNRRAFARCHRLLEGGGVVAVFPEGISHDEPTLQPLRTGAARIALSAPVGVDTVAVTLVYDDRQRFRSRALVRVGVPEPTGPWMERYRQDEPGTVRALTADLADRLRCDRRQYTSWTEATMLADIADVVARPTTVLPRPVSLVDRSLIVDDLTRARPASGPETRGRTGPGNGAGPLAPVEAAYVAYRQALDTVGLNDAQVAADYGSGRLRWHLARAAARVLVALPFALAGLAVHAVPYGLVALAGRVPDNVGVRATVKVLGSFLLYALTYMVIGLAVGRVAGAGLGVLAALAAPLCGYVALRMIERIHRVGGAVAGFRMMHTGGPVTEVLRSRRAAVVAAARVVLDPEP
jgi:glycerol-3-phosphate O-acyltransferase / dihydroxyacetone phosphate acyltransferase